MIHQPNNPICKLFNIELPIIQGGMVWCSGWRLASAVSNNGGLGLLGAGSMHPETLREHIKKTKLATSKPFGVNIPLFYPEITTIINIIIEEQVPIVFTSAGSPQKWTKTLQSNGIKVAHVVSSCSFAQKCEEAGVDAIVAEGFEAGGHNGREETTTMVLIPNIKQNCSLPLIAAGGIANGSSILAAFALGANAVQIGSLFASSKESSAHANFKNLVTTLNEGETKLSLKKLAPVRLVKNKLFNTIHEAEQNGASSEELLTILGSKRAKLGIFEGDLENGKLEIGQCSAYINSILSVDEIFQKLKAEYQIAKERIT